MDWIIQWSGLFLGIINSIWQIYPYWRNRPRLHLMMRKVDYMQKGKVIDKMTQILAINQGYSSIIISQIKMYFTNGDIKSLGIYDEHELRLGRHVYVLPKIVKSGEIVEFNAFPVSLVAIGVEKIEVIDSTGKAFLMPREEIDVVHQEPEIIKEVPLKEEIEKEAGKQEAQKIAAAS